MTTTLLLSIVMAAAVVRSSPSTSCCFWFRRRGSPVRATTLLTREYQYDFLACLRGGDDLSSSSQQHHSLDENELAEPSEAVANEQQEIQSHVHDEQVQNASVAGNDNNIENGGSSSITSSAVSPSWLPKKSRRASDLIVELQQRSGVTDPLSLELRQLITQRTAEYVSQLLGNDYQNSDHEQQARPKTHPLKLVHFLARKIPAIQHAPDIALRIQAAAADMDCGVAACVLGTTGHVCALYDQFVGATERNNDEPTRSSSSVAAQVAQDRRFEQLVECVLCGGVEILPRQRKKKRSGSEDSPDLADSRNKESSEGQMVDAEHIEQVISTEGIDPHAQQDGLSIRDSCRAAWGIAMIGSHHPTGIIGDVKVSDILTALSVRVRNLLLGRVQFLRQDDMIHGDLSTIEEGLDDFSDELAEDAASAMWTFACITGVMGVSFPALFDVCASILCQDPYDIRKRGQEDMETKLENLDDSQNIEETLETVAVGSSDVVERLAMSNTAKDLDDGRNVSSIEGEEVALSKTDRQDSQLGERTKNALLDWLSPDELTDVLWAAALHGGRNYTAASSSGADAVNLTRSLEAFCEMAFDRTACRLQKELEVIRTFSKEQVSATDSITESPQGADEVVIEVVHASTILNSEPGKHHEVASLDISTGVSIEPSDILAEEGAGNTIETEVVDEAIDSSETMGEEDVNDTDTLHREEVEATERAVSDQVIEACSILAPGEEPVENISHELTESGGLVTNTTASDQTAVAAGNEVATETELTTLNSQRAIDIEYNPQPGDDVAVESRAATRTDDAHISSPRDLCCLAWAVTELHDPLRFSITELVTNILVCIGMNSLSGLSGGDISNLAWSIAKNTKALYSSGTVSDPAGIALRWIADEALDYAALAASPNPSQIVLQRFHPPELSRLVWSITICMVGRESVPDSVTALVYHSLVTAGSHLSDFRTEDLARIVWAFLTLTNSQSVKWHHVPALLGQIISTIESQLLEWEKGVRAPLDDALLPDQKNSSPRLVSFFGKSRFHFPFIDFHIDNPIDESDESGRASTTTRLPLLRDLPVDPLTLCRVASSFTKLTAGQAKFKSSDTLLRICLRLLTSRNGRLMRECPFADLARLMEALSVSDHPSCRELTGLFVRRALHLVNELPEDDSGFVHFDLRPTQTGSFLSSLGDLHVRHSPNNENREIAHRRLHLVAKPSLPDPSSLSIETTIRILRGLVMLRLIHQLDSNYTFQLLAQIESGLMTCSSESDLCALMETIGILRKSIDEDIIEVSKNPPDLNRTSPAMENSDSPDETENTQETVEVICDRIVQKLGPICKELMPSMSNQYIIRIMTVLCQVPLQCNDLVDAVEQTIANRQQALGRVHDVESSVETATTCIRTLQESVSEHLPSSPLSAVQSGLRAMFGRDPKKSDDDKSSDSRHEDLDSVDQPTPGESVLNLEAMDHLLGETMSALKTLKEALEPGYMKGVQDCDDEMFELSCCTAAVEQYRSIDFGQGSTTRNPEKLSRVMTKRVLSRLLPE